MIQVDGLWKRYGFPMPEGLRRLYNRVRGRAPDEVRGMPWALEDVSFSVEPGESVGIVGRNGAGKSTLLKVLAGVTPPSRGRVRVEGRLFPMIELNAGIHPELTGRENVYLLGAVMGFSRREMHTRLSAIEDFCELGEWFERPVRMYSSGMLARLGFGVAMNVEADILLIDEILSVGDIGFQKKCYDRMRTLQAAGATMLIVSHSPYQIERLCSRSFSMDRGRITSIGSVHETISRYHQAVNEERLRHAQAAVSADAAETRRGTGDMRCRAVRVLDGGGEPADVLRVPEPWAVELDVEVLRECPTFWVRMDVVSPAQVVVNSFLFRMQGSDRVLPGRLRLRCDVRQMLLVTDVYSLDIVLKSDVLLDALTPAAQFHVEMSDPDCLALCNNQGIFYADAAWHLDASRSESEA